MGGVFLGKHLRGRKIFGGKGFGWTLGFDLFCLDQNLKWSWFGLLFSFSLGVGVGLVLILVLSWSRFWSSPGLSFGLCLGLSIGLGLK